RCEREWAKDGSEIRGNGDVKLAADGSLEGERMNVDDPEPLEFSLRPMAAGQKAPVAAAPAQAQKPAQPAAQPAAQPSAQQPSSQPAQSRGQAVNGVSNLTIGE